MIKISYSLKNDKELRLDGKSQIEGTGKLLKIELGMILFYLIKSKMFNKSDIDNLNDVVNDAVKSGVIDKEMLKMFLTAAYGTTFKE